MFALHKLYEVLALEVLCVALISSMCKQAWIAHQEIMYGTFYTCATWYILPPLSHSIKTVCLTLCLTENLSDTWQQFSKTMPSWSRRQLDQANETEWCAHNILLPREFKKLRNESASMI
jgi:hypothetical protein